MENKIEKISQEKGIIKLDADFGKFYVTVHNGQIMSLVKSDMTLYEKMGHIYDLQGKTSITAPGYKHLNKVASISLVTPQKVIVDQQQMMNPFIERDPRTKAVEAVNIRRMGIGFSPAGNIVVIDKTLFYNVYTYFLQSIQAKMKRRKWNQATNKYDGEPIYPNCAVYGVRTTRPDKPGSWVFFPIEGQLGIWANYEDEGMRECLDEHIQRQRFGDRIAQTIVDRNILKDHPAIAISQVYKKAGAAAGPYAVVTIYGWRNDNAPRDIADIMKQAEEGTGEGKEFEIKSDTIEQVNEQEEKAAISEEAERDDEPADQFLLDEQKEKK